MHRTVFSSRAARTLVLALALSIALAWLPEPAAAGVTNPDISVIGQPFLTSTNDPENPDHDHVRIDPGEVELMFDAALNPYAHGTFILSLGEEGLELEEGFFILTQGLPGRLALKGGQYRVGFGKMNPTHPHAMPFAERFRVLANYLPGDEALIEPGISLSELVPLPGDLALTLAADWLQGDSFRIDREPSAEPDDPLIDPDGPGDRGEETRAAFAARASTFTLVGEQSGLDLGVSFTQGTNNVAAGTHTTVLGADAKAKLWTSPQSYLQIQGEVLQLWQDQASWDPAGYGSAEVTPLGGYAYANYALSPRYNVGGGYEHYGAPVAGEPGEQAVKLFAGLSLLEETTFFSFDWDHFLPDEGDAIDTFTLRAIFSMGPHKAHQF
jgi:hypothetical protein